MYNIVTVMIVTLNFSMNNAKTIEIASIILRWTNFIKLKRTRTLIVLALHRGEQRQQQQQQDQQNESLINSSAIRFGIGTSVVL